MCPSCNKKIRKPGTYWKSWSSGTSKDSMIFCSQFVLPSSWSKLSDPLFPDAICDRIVRDAYTVVILRSGVRIRRILLVRNCLH